MPFANLAELKTAFVAWYEGDDLVGVEDDLVTLAESELSLRIRTRQRYGLQAIATIAGVSGYALTAGSQGVWFARFTIGDHLKLEYRPPESFYSDIAAFDPGTPRLYTLIGDTIEFGPIPDGEYQIRLGLWLDLDRLSATDPNWLLSSAPHVYLYACLVQAALYVQDDNAVQKWQALLDAALMRLHGAYTPTGGPTGRSVAS